MDAQSLFSQWNFYYHHLSVFSFSANLCIPYTVCTFSSVRLGYTSKKHYSPTKFLVSPTILGQGQGQGQGQG